MVIVAGRPMAEPNWENRTMWTGDNLDIMRGMNSESVDLIYLDPPFNSNRNYEAPIGSKAAGAAFKDTWTLSDVDVAWHGYLADKEPALHSVITAARQTHGRSMMSYLIMMGIRLIEMRRILGGGGSIYLHCDPTAGHYLKLLMDSVFGARNFRSDITWQRTTTHNDAKVFGRVKDVVLYYTESKTFTWNPVEIEHDQAYIDSMYRHEDTKGRYRLHSVARNPALGIRPNLVYDYGGYTPTFGWMMTYDKLKALDDDGLLVWSKTGKPYRKIYLTKGKPATNVWVDIQIPGKKERVGYPTQKPLALLERIIKASTNEGDVVLDPFAGCATACVSAEMLNRKWVGIDISKKAVELVRVRIEQMIDLFGEKIIQRDKPPKRTDQGAIPNYRTHKHRLYGCQEGQCICGEHFPFRNFTIDHKVPRSKSGTDHIDNLMLLCGACNSAKGTGDVPYLIAALKSKGIKPCMEVLRPCG